MHVPQAVPARHARKVVLYHRAVDVCGHTERVVGIVLNTELDIMNDTNNSSPLSSSSDNSDVVNTSSAKVYFGPVQSPEKKFAPMLSPCKPSTQSIDDFGSSSPRRSPRLSSPQPTHPNGYDQDETEQEEEREENDELSAEILWEDTHCQQILRQDGKLMYAVAFIFSLTRTRTIICHCKPYYAGS